MSTVSHLSDARADREDEEAMRINGIVITCAAEAGINLVMLSSFLHKLRDRLTTADDRLVAAAGLFGAWRAHR